MKWKVRGLEPKFDKSAKAYLIKPGESVKRCEMAFMLEDVLMKLTADEGLATAFWGRNAPRFLMSSRLPFLQCSLNMTTRNIREGELSGDFRLNDPLGEAKVALAIPMLQQRINIH